MNFNFLNPFSDKFLAKEPEQSYIQQVQATQNSIGRDEDGINWNALLPTRTNGFYDPTNPCDSNGILFDAVFATKSQRISFYRSMALYPLVTKALITMSNEVVNEDCHGNLLKFGIKDAFSKNFKRTELISLEDEFNYVVNTVIKRDDLWTLFYRWLVDAEQFWELCANDEGDRLLGIKVLPAFCSLVIYDEGLATGYMQDPRLIDIQTRDQPKVFTLDQVAYASYGNWASNRNDVRGMLEPAIRHLNQLRSIEDALTVYRITRAPEKRIFKIYTGALPPSRVPSYMHELKGQYRKSLSLDPATGAINSSKNVQALTEDYWFSTGDSGHGSSVEPYKASTEFNGQIEDLKIFQKMVMDAIHFPSHRWHDDLAGAGSSAQYSQNAETSLSEIEFQKECRRLGDRFTRGLIVHTFIQHLRLRGFNAKFLNKDIYNIKFNYSSDFEKIKAIGMAEKLASQVTSFKDLMPSLANSKPTSEEQAPIFSKYYVMHKLLGMSDEDYAMNEEWLKKEKEAIIDAAQQSADEGGEVETADEDFAF